MDPMHLGPGHGNHSALRMPGRDDSDVAHALAIRTRALGLVSEHASPSGADKCRCWVEKLLLNRRIRGPERARRVRERRPPGRIWGWRRLGWP